MAYTKRALVVCLLSAVSSSHARANSADGGVGGGPEAQSLRQSVDGSVVKSVTEALVSPLMEGRGTGQRGGERAARFLEEAFRAAQLAPLPGHKSRLEAVDLRGFRFEKQATLRLAGRNLKLGEDFAPLTYWMSRARWPEHIDVAGELVFVGLGVTNARAKHDDLNGLELQGKLAVLFVGVPGDANIAEWAGVDHVGIVRELAQRGVKGVVAIAGKALLDTELYSLTRRAATLWSSEPALPPVVAITEGVARDVFKEAGLDFDRLEADVSQGKRASQPLGLTGQLVLNLKYEKHEANAYNVVGFIQGTDASVTKEAIVITAHYDAFGREPDGRFFPGAGDNAVGVGKLVAVGQALARKPPRRSVLVVATTGEELWLLGATGFLSRPEWPLQRIAAELNIDGIGSETWGPVRMLHVMAYEESTLGSDASAIAEQLGLEVLPDTMTATRLLQRSDTFEFARRGIPSIYVVGYPDHFDKLGAEFSRAFGTAIHRQGDVIGNTWKWQGATTVAEFYFRLAERVANSPTPPVWTPGSAFAQTPGGSEISK